MLNFEAKFIFVDPRFSKFPHIDEQSRVIATVGKNKLTS